MVNPLPAWVSQEHLSREFFGDAGVATLRNIEFVFGHFVWATEFANIHSNIHFDEPTLVIEGLSYAGNFLCCTSTEWLGPEQYYQSQKLVDGEKLRNVSPALANECGRTGEVQTI